MFGDNKRVVDSSMTQTEKIHKRYTLISFHRVRESKAAGIRTYQFIDRNHNPEDVLNKH